MFNKILSKIYNKQKNVKSGKIYKIFTILGIRIKICIGIDNSLHVNKYLQNIKPYKVVPHKIWDIDPDKRNNVLKLDWNEATIPPSPAVLLRLEKLLNKDNFFNLYPRTINEELTQKLAKYAEVPIENVQYFASSDAIHEYIAKMYIAENDKVLIQAPSYDNFRLTVQANGGRVFYSEVDENFQFDNKIFEKDIKKIRPSFIYLCSPNNPCGFQHSTEYIEKLLTKYPEIMFLVDEAYYEFSETTAKDLILSYDNILITRTMSKAFALANFRFGYLLASKTNIASINSIRNPKNITTFSQEAVLAALSDIDYMKQFVKQVKDAREYFINAMQKYNKYIKIHPSCANFVLIKCSSYSIKANLFEYLKQHNIFVRDLSQCQKLYPCIRITIGTTSQMQKVVNFIDKFFEDFNAPKANQNSNKLVFLDFCGTVVNYQTGNAYIDYVKKHNYSFIVRLRELKNKILIKLGKKMNKRFYDKTYILNQVKDLSYAEMDRCALNFYVEEIRPYFIPQILKEIKRLKKENYRIYVVSGGYDIYLKYFVDEFKLDGLFCTKIKFKNNKCKATFDGLDCMFDNKPKIIKAYFKDEPLDQYEVIGYTDSISDLPMLKLCTKGYVVSKNIPTKWASKYNYNEIVYQ